MAFARLLHPLKASFQFGATTNFWKVHLPQHRKTILLMLKSPTHICRNITGVSKSGTLPTEVSGGPTKIPVEVEQALAETDYYDDYMDDIQGTKP